MPQVTLFNMQGEKTGNLTIKDEIFAVKPNRWVLHQAHLRQLANNRGGNANTKTRAEVRGGGRKPWKQKKTGRARHGSNSSPLWVGGGVTFGPRTRDFSQAMPRQMRRLALRSALSSKVAEDQFIALDKLSMVAPRTKEFISMLGKLNVDGPALFIIKDANLEVQKSASNLPNVKVITADGINVHDILKYRKLIMTKDAINWAEEVLI